jgi:hypothetical protein
LDNISYYYFGTGEVIDSEGFKDIKDIKDIIREEVIKALRFKNFIKFCPRPIIFIRNAAKDITFRTFIIIQYYFIFS